MKSRGYTLTLLLGLMALAIWEFSVVWLGTSELVLPAPTRVDRKSTRLNSSHIPLSRMPSSA